MRIKCGKVIILYFFRSNGDNSEEIEAKKIIRVVKIPTLFAHEIIGKLQIVNYTHKGY